MQVFADGSQTAPLTKVLIALAIDVGENNEYEATAELLTTLYSASMSAVCGHGSLPIQPQICHEVLYFFSPAAHF